jgi:hypothetical protein
MAMDPKDIQERIETGARPPVNVRNINYDTHIGHAPQRPYALLEDHMAAVTTGHADIKALQASLASAPKPEGLPDGAPNPNEVKDEGGVLVRYVVSQQPREVFATDGGQLRERVRFERRAVAPSQQMARAASENGTPTDFWNGFTWLRDGYKPERDVPAMAQAAARDGEQGLVFDAPLAPTEAAQVRHEINRANVAHPPVPIEAAQSTRKEGK